MLAGCTRLGSHGSMRIRPSCASRRIVPSESTDAREPSMGRKVCHPARIRVRARSVPERPSPGLDGPNAGRGGRRRITMRAAARMAWEGLARMVTVALDAAVVVGVRELLGLLLHRPPDE